MKQKSSSDPICQIKPNVYPGPSIALAKERMYTLGFQISY